MGLVGLSTLSFDSWIPLIWCLVRIILRLGVVTFFWSALRLYAVRKLRLNGKHPPHRVNRAGDLNAATLGR